MEKMYDEKGYLISGFSDAPSIPIQTNWLKSMLTNGSNEKGLSNDQIYENVLAVSEKMNSVSHVFHNDDDENNTLLTDKQRVAAINMMFHLARHEYSFAVKEFVKCIGNEERSLTYNEAVLFSILADAFENTMTYRKHRVPDAFSQTVNRLALLVDGEGNVEVNVTVFVREFYKRVRPWKSNDPFYEKGCGHLLSGFLSYFALKRRFIPFTLFDVEETLQKELDQYFATPAAERNIYLIVERYETESAENPSAKNQFVSAKTCPPDSLERIFVGLLADVHYIVSEYDEKQVKKMVDKR